jgi:hypothetical protein
MFIKLPAYNIDGEEFDYDYFINPKRIKRFYPCYHIPNVRYSQIDIGAEETVIIKMTPEELMNFLNSNEHTTKFNSKLENVLKGK